MAMPAREAIDLRAELAGKQLHMPDKAEVSQGALAAFLAEGLINDKGRKDNAALREQAVTLLIGPDHLVTGPSTKERGEKAVTKGDLMTALFPHTPDPDSLGEDAEDPELAAAVYQKLGQDLWNQLVTSSKGSVQRLLGNNGLPNAVLCRARIGPDLTPAVFVTTNAKAKDRDLVGAENLKFTSVLRQRTDTRAMLIDRAETPAEAKRLADGMTRMMNAEVTAASERLALAVAARTANGSQPEPGDSEV